MLEILKNIDNIKDYIEELRDIFKVIVAETQGWDEKDVEIEIVDIDDIIITHKRGAKQDEYFLTVFEFARFLKYGEEGI